MLFHKFEYEISLFVGSKKSEFFFCTHSLVSLVPHGALQQGRLVLEYRNIRVLIALEIRSFCLELIEAICNEKFFE